MVRIGNPMKYIFNSVLKLMKSQMQTSVPDNNWQLSLQTTM